jgi:hypothetical protein
VAPGTIDPPALVRLARLVSQGLSVDLARDSLDLCIGDPPAPGRAIVARRKLPGYVSSIDSALLARAATAAVGPLEGSLRFASSRYRCVHSTRVGVVRSMVSFVTRSGSTVVRCR